MFSQALRLKLYSVISAFFGINVYGLIYLRFGTSTEAKLFLVAAGTYSIFQLIVSMFTEQFVYKYARLKEESKNRADGFFHAYLVTIILISAFLCPVYYYASLYFVNIGIYDVPLYSRTFYKDLTISYLPMVLVFAPLQILSQYSQALQDYAHCYLRSTISNISMSSYLIISFLIDMDLVDIIKYSSATVLIFVICTVVPFFSKCNIKLNESNYVFSCILSSVKMRFSHNIHNVFTLALINSYSTTLNSSMGSQMLYARKGAETIMNVIYGPIHKVIINEISAGYSFFYDNYNIIKLRKYITSAFLFAVIVALIGVVIPSGNIANKSLDIFFVLYFTTFSLQYMVMCYELPYAVLCNYEDKYQVFFMSNLIYVCFAYFIFSLLTECQVVLYQAAPLSLCLAQFINYTLIVKAAKKILKNASA